MPPDPQQKDAPEGAPGLLISPPTYQEARESSSAESDIPGSVPIEQDLAVIAKWLALIFRFLEAVARRDLEKLELKILIVLLLESWRCRCKFIWLHEDKILSGLTKIHSQNLTRPLARLVSYSILKREAHEHGSVYRLQPNVRAWTAPFNRGLPAVRKSAKYMKRIVGQLQLALKPRELEDMLEQLSFEAALESPGVLNSSCESLTVSERARGELLTVSDSETPQSLTVSETALRGDPHINVDGTVTVPFERPTSNVSAKVQEDLLADVLEFFRGSQGRDRDLEGAPFNPEKEMAHCDYTLKRLAACGKANTVRETMALIVSLENSGHPTTANRAARLLAELRKRSLEISWPQIFRGAS